MDPCVFIVNTQMCVFEINSTEWIWGRTSTRDMHDTVCVCSCGWATWSETVFWPDWEPSSRGLNADFDSLAFSHTSLIPFSLSLSNPPLSSNLSLCLRATGLVFSSTPFVFCPFRSPLLFVSSLSLSLSLWLFSGCVVNANSLTQINRQHPSTTRTHTHTHTLCLHCSASNGVVGQLIASHHQDWLYVDKDTNNQVQMLKRAQQHINKHLAGLNIFMSNVWDWKIGTI